MFAIMLIGFLGSDFGVKAEPQTPIDRHALVSRHDIDWRSLNGQIPLGNGNFAFNADGTGLETVGGNTMCHWCWHNFPLPSGFTKSDLKPWATLDHGHITGDTTPDPKPLADWQRVNPQPLNLGRLGFVSQDGERLNSTDVQVDSRHLELWTGHLTSHFTYLGKSVTVQTCVDPRSDTVAVHVESTLFRDGQLQLMLDFPAPAQNVGAWVGDFSEIAGHQTMVVQHTHDWLKIKRTIDDAQYEVVLTGRGFTVRPPIAMQPEIESARFGVDGRGWTNVTAQVAGLIRDHGAVIANKALFGDPAVGFTKQLELKYRVNEHEHTSKLSENESWSISGPPSPHRFTIVPESGIDAIDLTCHFGTHAASGAPIEFADVKRACATSWPAFWNSGGAIDLSKSKDQRWNELERRIVLSQYELAVQSAGDNPPAEVGLTGTDPWLAKWHFEMIWWHLAHYALWDRWPMAEKALTIYPRVALVARSIAANFGYRGLMWPKSTGPNGYNDGFPPEMALLWKEPHPIFFAELDYRLHPTPETLAKWKDIVFGTAEFMADYPTRNPSTGQYSLDPVWPASEGKVSPLRRNTIFELAYWHFGLNLAQQWRQRLGLSREPHWDDVARHLAPLPEKDGLYIFSDDRPDTFTTRTFDHVDIIGIDGMLPPFQGLDLETARRTLEEVGRRWNWDATWGWDFPWMAMAAARIGDPKLAVEALLNPSPKNYYDERGICTGGPGPYLPGNGGLLYAVAMMAAGWDGGPKQHAPGFPKDGSWTVHWEDLKPAP
ncbi:MAG: hypothetical protein ABSE48_07395 [Verrucomicrobiota bacterium]